MRTLLITALVLLGELIQILGLLEQQLAIE